MSYNIDTTNDGEYVLTISSTKPLAFLNTLMAATGQKVDIKHGYVVLYNAGTDRIFSHLAAYTQQQGDQVRSLLTRAVPCGVFFSHGDRTSTHASAACEGHMRARPLCHHLVTKHAIAAAYPATAHRSARSGPCIPPSSPTITIFRALLHSSCPSSPQVGLQSRMYDSTTEDNSVLTLGEAPLALPDVVKTAYLEAVFPDGHRCACMHVAVPLS